MGAAGTGWHRLMGQMQLPLGWQHISTPHPSGTVPCMPAPQWRGTHGLSTTGAQLLATPPPPPWHTVSTEVNTLLVTQNLSGGGSLLPVSSGGSPAPSLPE